MFRTKSSGRGGGAVQGAGAARGTASPASRPGQGYQQRAVSARRPRGRAPRPDPGPPARPPRGGRDFCALGSRPSPVPSPPGRRGGPGEAGRAWTCASGSVRGSGAALAGDPGGAGRSQARRASAGTGARVGTGPGGQGTRRGARRLHAGTLRLGPAPGGRRRAERGPGVGLTVMRGMFFLPWKDILLLRPAPPPRSAHAAWLRRGGLEDSGGEMRSPGGYVGAPGVQVRARSAPRGSGSRSRPRPGPAPARPRPRPAAAPLPSSPVPAVLNTTTTTPNSPAPDTCGSHRPGSLRPGSRGDRQTRAGWRRGGERCDRSRPVCMWSLHLRNEGGRDPAMSCQAPPSPLPSRGPASR